MTEKIVCFNQADAWLARFEKSERTRADFMDLWSSADVEGTGRITILQLQRILKLKEDDDLMAKFKEEVGDTKLDFYDYAKLALRQRRGIYVDRPTWAKKKDLDAAQRTFIPAVSAETIQCLLSFVDRHTIFAIDAMIESKRAVKERDSTDAEIQTVALKLVVAVLNDLIRFVHSFDFHFRLLPALPILLCELLITPMVGCRPNIEL